MAFAIAVLPVVAPAATGEEKPAAKKQLYHNATDPLQWTNLANKPEYAEPKAGLAKWLPTVNNETPGGQMKDPDKKAKRAKRRAEVRP